MKTTWYLLLILGVLGVAVVLLAIDGVSCLRTWLRKKS
jgi:hypothetical protein